MQFKSWLEAVMAPSKVGNDIGNINFNDDDDGNDDDESWNWDNVEKNFGDSIRDWIESSPCVKKIKGKILERIFNTNFQVTEPEIIHNGKEETMPPQGWVSIVAYWEYPVDEIEEPLFNTLRDNKQCDLWKALKIQPQETWNTLDKGELFHFIHHYINMSLSGIFNKKIQPDKSQPNWGTRWQIQYTDHLKDKLTITKYARFKSQEIQEEVENKIKEYLEYMYDYYNHQEVKMEINLHEEPRTVGQVYDRNYIGNIKYLWEYHIV